MLSGLALWDRDYRPVGAHGIWLTAEKTAEAAVMDVCILALSTIEHCGAGERVCVISEVGGVVLLDHRDGCVMHDRHNPIGTPLRTCRAMLE